MSLLTPRLPLICDVTAENESQSFHVLVIGEDDSALTPIFDALIDTFEPMNEFDDCVTWVTFTAIEAAFCVVGLPATGTAFELTEESARPRMPASVRLLMTP